jgi:hypothetical protein
MPAELRAGIPSDPGCVLYTHGDSTRTGEYHAMVHLPPQGTAAPVRVALTMTTLSALDAFAFEAGHTVEVRTVETPVGVAVIGLGLDGLDADVLLDTPEQRRTMRRLVRTFPWTAGTTVAVFAPTDSQSARVGAVLPLAKPWRAEKVLRRFLKVAGAAGAAPSRVDGTHARVTLTQGRRKQTLHVAAREGQLLVASDPVLLATMEGGSGSAWVTGATAEAAKRYPIVLSGVTSPSAANPPWFIAVDFPPSALTAQIGLPLTFDQVRTGIAVFGGVFRANLERVRGALPTGDAAPPTSPP